MSAAEALKAARAAGIHLGIDGDDLVLEARLARALAARTGPPRGWTWRISNSRKSGLPSTFRTPPAPYRERVYSLGPGFCSVCGQPVYRLGWHKDLWAAGPNKRAAWHCACVVAWQFWCAPNGEAPTLRRLQARRCGLSGGRLWKTAEVTTVFRSFKYGANTAIYRGQSCWTFGACQTFRS
jgi:hypothetical protein